ncbi:MAG: RsmB/NOP family class I SAM-dependent RNA methyltransferase [Caldisphaera sp.]|jgi:NOL1/NOP2/sun family putative RNA methylase|nr:RsmB/NOP family class I SAM-dependent RNA methyltransferase [Caldisphaera sp.]PMP61057.1 MAG: RNA (cytosine-C(5)-)-methyltransferase [Caldisphaera sp.]PMP88593.1 MAG: RNA (cytosine-C(5)-)-methyltransferase [Caldisphaera sp.]
MDKWKEIDDKVFNYKINELAEKLAKKYGYSSYIVERYLMLLGKEETIELLQANEASLPETIRCNDFLIKCNKLEKRLKEKGFKIGKIPFLPHGYEIIKSPYKPGATHEYLMGYYYIQDPGSMLITYLLNPRKNEIIVDMAAAPGGKSSQILQLTNDNVRLIAVELKSNRVKSLRSNLQRMGFSSYLILETDARKLNLKDIDRVLLDSPSSGEGIIRKDPRRKTSRPRGDMKKIHRLQLNLLNKGLDLLKNGGEMIYAACSTAIEEGEYVINKILHERSNVDIVKVNSPIGSNAFIEFNGVKFDDRISSCLRLWPHRDGTEGFFICKLKKLQD